jgi:hypothetical protein
MLGEEEVYTDVGNSTISASVVRGSLFENEEFVTFPYRNIGMAFLKLASMGVR